MIDRRFSQDIGGKGLNCGIRLGLFDAKHYEAVGDAVWLFGWLVGRQTTQRNGEGLVLRGKALSYGDISRDTGFKERTLRRWMLILTGGGYVQVKHSVYGRMVIRILNAKKFTGRQAEFFREPYREQLMQKQIESRPAPIKTVRSVIEPSVLENTGSLTTNLRPVAVMPSRPAPKSYEEISRERERQLAALREKFPEAM